MTQNEFDLPLRVKSLRCANGETYEYTLWCGDQFIARVYSSGDKGDALVDLMRTACGIARLR